MKRLTRAEPLLGFLIFRTSVSVVVLVAAECSAGWHADGSQWMFASCEALLTGYESRFSLTIAEARRRLRSMAWWGRDE
jgi:hypothetical protein